MIGVNGKNEENGNYFKTTWFLKLIRRIYYYATYVYCDLQKRDIHFGNFILFTSSLFYLSSELSWYGVKLYYYIFTTFSLFCCIRGKKVNAKNTLGYEGSLFLYFLISFFSIIFLSSKNHRLFMEICTRKRSEWSNIILVG